MASAQAGLLLVAPALPLDTQLRCQALGSARPPGHCVARCVSAAVDLTFPNGQMWRLHLLIWKSPFRY